MKFYIFILFLIFSIKAFPQAPKPPKIIKVSFEDIYSFDKTIYWESSSSTNVVGYFIKVKQDPYWVDLDTVANVNSYVHHSTEPYATSYRISAINSNNEQGIMCDSHTSMYLFPYFDPQLDYCNKRTRLIWSAYKGWDYVSKYNIYSKKNSESWLLIGSVTGTEIEFHHQNIEYSQLYSYYVEAVSPDDIRAESNVTSVFTTDQDAPTFVYAEQASVSGDNVVLSFSIDEQAVSKGYEIQRSENLYGPFETITTLSGSSISPLSYTDKLEDIKDIFYYRLGVLDICNNVVLTSNIASNIVLNINNSRSLDASLEWNSYSEWESGIDNYKIYRQFDDSAPVLIDSISPSSIDYVDKFESEIENARNDKMLLSGNVCYYIEAYEKAEGDSLGIIGISRSNKVCKTMEPVIYMPNAISLNSNTSANKVLLPLVTFATKDYKFMVFDKYGENIFSTSDIYQAWDGKAKGSDYVPIGTYKWILKFTTANGKEYSKLGNITVIK